MPIISGVWKKNCGPTQFAIEAAIEYIIRTITTKPALHPIKIKLLYVCIYCMYIHNIKWHKYEWNKQWTEKPLKPKTTNPQKLWADTVGNLSGLWYWRAPQSDHELSSQANCMAIPSLWHAALSTRRVLQKPFKQWNAWQKYLKIQRIWTEINTREWKRTSIPWEPQANYMAVVYLGHPEHNQDAKEKPLNHFNQKSTIISWKKKQCRTQINNRPTQNSINLCNTIKQIPLNTKKNTEKYW